MRILAKFILVSVGFIFEWVKWKKSKLLRFVPQKVFFEDIHVLKGLSGLPKLFIKMVLLIFILLINILSLHSIHSIHDVYQQIPLMH